MTGTREALAAMGWRVDTAARLRRAVSDFQLGYNLDGAPLVADGIDGPKTRAALAVSMQRRKEGKPDFSEHFSAREFACACGGSNPGCRRIWIIRSAVRLAETLRPVIGPFTPRTGCRCTVENARVGGAKNSQHLYGAALDLGTDATVYDLPVAAVKRLGVASGIGFYDAGDGRTAVRHVDVRHVSGNNTTRSTTANPAEWIYGILGSRRVVPLNPGAAKPAPPVTPQPERSWFDMATKDELRAVVREEIAAAFADEARWRRVLTGMAFFKDPTTPNRGESPDEPRIPLGRLMEIAGISALEAKDVPLEFIRAAVADAIKAIDVTVRTDTQGEKS